MEAKDGANVLTTKKFPFSWGAILTPSTLYLAKVKFKELEHAHGYIGVPKGPDLGLEPNEEMVAKYAVR